MADTDLIEQLARHATLGAAPREELAWLASHGELRSLASGDVLTGRGAVVEGLFVILTGAIAIFVDRGAGPHKVMEWRAGDVTGLLPYSRMVTPPGDTAAQEPCTLLAVHRDVLPEMIRDCHQVTSILVHKMLDRARHFTSSALHDEKMASLGRLAAGLAHELNNPAAAIQRSAALLEERLVIAERAIRSLGVSHASDEQVAAVDALRTVCLASSSLGVLSPVQRADREDAIADWLSAHGLHAADVAETLADTAVTIDALEQVATSVDGPALEAGLSWAAASCAVRQLASEIGDAATRISALVQAVKGFTHMDQATVAEPMDLGSSLGNTITILKSKARAKSVAVTVEVEPNLPRVRGFVGELNQVWANLIDNALDAVADNGRVAIRARRQRDRVVVSIVDNGAGISPETRARMFDPFFTTKPVGQGTGLGLDIVRRLLTHNDGSIDCESTPGHTEFLVSLPIAPAPSPSAEVPRA